MCNVPRQEGFTQVCVWEGVIVDEEKLDEFTSWWENEFGGPVQYLETIETGPGKGGSGGRLDVFLAVDMSKLPPDFSIKRLAYGIRWVEDVLAPVNGGSVLYPGRVREYMSWVP